MGLLSRMSRAATALTKYYFPFTWRDKPSIESPINEVHLNHMEDGINEMDNRILLLAQDKADAADMANVIIDFTMDDTTGVMTFTRFDGSTFTHDTAVEKIALNCYLEGDNFVLELADGTKQKVSLSKFIDTYTFSSTDTIRITANGKNISADIPDGKITLAKLEPTILSTIRQYTLDAQTSKGVAEQAASTAQGWAIGGTGFEGNNAKYYASKSQRYAVGGVEEGDAKDNAKAYCEAAKGYAEQCAGVTEFDGTATSVKATDTQGLVVAAGADSNAQALLDVLARKVALELVSNTALAEKLVDYVAKTDIVQVESTATNKVPSSAYLKQVKDSIDSNLESIKDIGAAALLGTITATGAVNSISYNLNDYKRLEVQLYNMENKIIGCCTLLPQNISPQINAWINSYYDGATHCNVQFSVSTDSIYVISFSNSNVWTSCYIKVFGVK